MAHFQCKYFFLLILVTQDLGSTMSTSLFCINFRYGTYLNQSLLIQEFCLYLCLLIKSIPYKSWVSFIKSTRYKESEDQAQKYILKNQITIFFTLFLSLTERVLRFQIHMSRATHKFQNTSLRVVILFAISHYYITKATPLQNSIFFLRSSSIFLNFFFEVGKLKIG